MLGRSISNEDITSGKVLVIGINAEAKWEKCPHSLTRGKTGDGSVCKGWSESESSNYADFCRHYLADTGECALTMRAVRGEA